MKVTIENLPLGAQISGLDLRQPMSGRQLGMLRQTIHAHGVVAIRGQDLTPEEQIGFGRYIGEPEEHVLTHYLLPGYPELLVVSNIVENGRQIGIVDAGGAWHSDLAYKKRPTYLSMLYAVEVPHREDGTALGDTSFLSAAFAYDTLPAELKQALSGRTSISSYAARSKKRHAAGSARITPTQQQLDSVKDVEHPVFRQHPYCDKTCIYVSKVHTTRIAGFDEKASNEYLDQLVAHMVRPEFIYRHSWRKGDLVIWDNAQTQHIVSFDYAANQRRRMHRLSLKGTIPWMAEDGKCGANAG